MPLNYPSDLKEDISDLILYIISGVCRHWLSYDMENESQSRNTVIIRMPALDSPFCLLCLINPLGGIKFKNGISPVLKAKQDNSKGIQPEMEWPYFHE